MIETRYMRWIAKEIVANNDIKERISVTGGVQSLAYGAGTDGLGNIESTGDNDRSDVQQSKGY